LAGRARSVAAWLRKISLPGDRALLAYPAGPDFAIAFLACLYAGVIAVPVDLPRRRDAAALARIFDNSGAVLLLAHGTLRDRLPDLGPGWLFTDALEGEPAGSEAFARPSPDAIAYIQYTSGSTRAPRGAAISHRALAEQLDFYRRRAGDGAEALTFVGWLPHTHDFGLVGFLLSALYMGRPYVWMPASAFLRRPMRWIEAISRYRGSYCGAPAFAYDLCAAAASETRNEALDLSCWQIASLGGDYVTPATLARFEAAFAPAGFRSEAWLPAYGLAESVLCATGRNGAAVTGFDAAALREGRALPAGDGDAVALVSSGTPLAGQRVRIVDPDADTPIMDGAVGEIWLAGASLADGYWNDPAATAAQFGARIAGEADDAYLRTGDCGFMYGGELFVTGRLKDMIVVHGRNHAPDDIEQTIQDADLALRRGTGAVFQTGAEDGARLVAVQEAPREVDAAALFAAINQAVTARHGIALDAIRLLRIGSLPRTRTGKIARGAVRTGAAAATLHEHAVWTRAAWSGTTQVEAELIAQLRAILPGQAVAADDNLLALGLESLGVQQLIGWLGRRYGVEPPLDAIFEMPTVAGIARLVGEVPPRDVAAPAPAPGDATLAAVLEELRRLNLLVAEQGRLLASLVGQTSPLPQPEPGEPARDRFALTEMQQEIRLLGELRQDAASVFHAVMVLEFATAPDEAIVRDTLRRLGRRHEALRTVFEDGEQRVLADSEPIVERVVLTEPPDAWLRDERRRAFAPDAPPWRATIVAAPVSQFLVVTAHHLALDGASFAVLAREFAALHADPAAALPEPVQFRDTRAARQREAARRDDAEWWQGMLGRDLPDWQPPRLLPAMHRVRYDSMRVPVAIDAPMRAALVARGTAGGATLFQTLFVAYAVLLHRVSRQERVLIGVDAANRGEADSALLGCCNLLVPVVADFGMPGAVGQLPARLQQSLARREYTLSMWARDQRIAVDPARPFKIIATINYQRLAARAGGLIPRFDLEAMATDANPFGLTLDIRDTGDALRVDLIHNPKFLSGADAARFARYFRRLLDVLAEEASPDLLALPLHGAEEAAQLARWGGVGQAAPAYVPLLDRFAAQRAATPAAPAITCADAALTYAALDALSDRLAGSIAARVVSGASVALLATRGCDALAAMLAVWKAGCVYVPLDPKGPDARLARLCAQAEVALLLHDGAHAVPDPALPALRIDQPCDAPPPVRPGPDGSAPAYLLFTSGSTGEAKAALVSHGGMANHLQAKIDVLGLGNGDCIAQTAEHGFDISLWQYLAPLAVGGSVRVLDDATTHDPKALFVEADRAGVTVLELVPSMLRAGLEQLIRQGGRVPFARLRWLISTGEALAADLCRRWIALYPRVPVVNAYGPTECSDDVTHHIAEWAPPPDAPWAPIGRPIRGAVLHVVDACGNPVPPGTPGELLVGGACVGLGYRGDPVRSAAAFVPDRFSGAVGATL
jgi:amino acid adenylation domain-containing protein